MLGFSRSCSATVTFGPGRQYCPELLTPLNRSVRFSRFMPGEVWIDPSGDPGRIVLSAEIVWSVFMYLSMFTIVNYYLCGNRSYK
jgi:hypothetical protein